LVDEVDRLAIGLEPVFLEPVKTADANDPWRHIERHTLDLASNRNARIPELRGDCPPSLNSASRRVRIALVGFFCFVPSK